MALFFFRKEAKWGIPDERSLTIGNSIWAEKPKITFLFHFLFSPFQPHVIPICLFLHFSSMLFLSLFHHVIFCISRWSSKLHPFDFISLRKRPGCFSETVLMGLGVSWPPPVQQHISLILKILFLIFSFLASYMCGQRFGSAQI